MADPITLETAQIHLNSWLAADLAISQGQEYEIDTGGTRRKLKRVDAATIKKNIDYWRGLVSKLQSGSGKPKMKLVVNRD